MKLYIVNEQNLYHECKNNALDSLFFRDKNGLYWCNRCNKESNSTAFFCFREDNKLGLACFSSLSPVISYPNRDYYRVIEL